MMRTITHHSGADFEANRTGRPRGEQLEGIDVALLSLESKDYDTLGSRHRWSQRTRAQLRAQAQVRSRWADGAGRS